MKKVTVYTHLLMCIGCLYCLAVQTGCAYSSQGGSTGAVGLVDLEVVKWEETHDIDLAIRVKVPLLTSWLEKENEDDS